MILVHDTPMHGPLLPAVSLPPNFRQLPSPGNYMVTATTADGCFTSSDTVVAAINPLPPMPSVTDDVVINVNDTNPTTIELCDPDTVFLTAGNLVAGNAFTWNGPGLGPNGVTDTTIMVTMSGFYTILVEDPGGCQNSTTVNVIIHEELPPFFAGSERDGQR